MRSRIKPTLRLLLAVVCLALLLCACGKKEETPPPESYPVTADESVPALTQILSEQERAEVSYSLLEQGGGESNEPTSHEYANLSNSGRTVQDYVEELTKKHNCQILEKKDDEYVTTSQPDYTQGSGSLLVGKESQEKEGLLLLTLTWSEGTCKVERIFLPEEKIAFSMPVSLTEASDRVKGWLEQDGKKLEDYVVQAEEGLVRLEDSVCITVNVYAEADHALLTSYLVETKSGTIYEMDRVNKEAIPLG